MANSELQDIMRECSRSCKVFAKVFFPERFTLPFSANIHDPIFDFIDNETNPLQAIAAPRSCGKTSIFNLVLPARDIIFGLGRYIVQISASAKLATNQSDNLKAELVSNTLITKLVGNLQSDKWAVDEWTTSNGVHVLPRGAGQQIRGLLWQNYRPNRINIDDLENDEDVLNKDLRLKLKNWFNESVLLAVDRIRKDYFIRVVGTVLHEDSFLQGLLNNKNWASLRLELFDDDFHSYWPEYMSDDEIKALAQQYRDEGNLNGMFRELRNLPIAGENQQFKSEFFRRYESDQTFQNCDTFVVWDPARTVKEGSDETAIVGISIDLTKNHIYIRDVCHGRFHPTEQYESVLAMAARLGTRVVGVEVTALNEFITHPFLDHASARGQFIQLIELKPRGGNLSKLDRISQLVPYYRAGNVFHNPTCCGALEAQLLAFPRSKYDDVSDAVAYVIEMMDIGERQFFANPSLSGYSVSEQQAYEEMLEEDRRDSRATRELNLLGS